MYSFACQNTGKTMYNTLLTSKKKKNHGALTTMILITFYCSALIKNTLLMPYIFNIRARVAPIVN